MIQSNTTMIRRLSLAPKYIAIFLPALYLGPLVAESLPLADIDDWTKHSFEGESRFDWRPGQECLLMTSADTASARIWEQETTLNNNTRISWRWLATEEITGVARQKKVGDDFAGRVYVAVEHPLFFWRSRVLAYVHASEFPVNTHWPNPFTGQFHMWVVSNGDTGQWQTVERRILDDWEAAFGDRPEHFDAIGLMADSDNSDQQTQLCITDLEITDAGGN